MSLLASKGIPFMPSGKDFLISCLNPDHDDRNPSLRVDKVTGIAHCFSCGWKRNLFKHYGLFTNTTPIRVQKLKEKIVEIRESAVDVPVPAGHTPFTQSYRGISAATYKHFEAFYTSEVPKLEDRVVFPIKDTAGRTTAFIGRHTLSSGNPKYLVYPSGKPLPCYPSIVESGSTIVLVEGIFDMLNLYDKGMRNAVTMFGTQSLKSAIKEKMLPFKIQGVTKVFLMLDGDNAGRAAAKELKPLLEQENFTVEIIELPDDQDPGELDQASVDSIKEYTK